MKINKLYLEYFQVFVPCDSQDIIFWTNDSWSPPTAFSSTSSTTINNNTQIPWTGNGSFDLSRNTTVNGSSIVFTFEGDIQFFRCYCFGPLTQYRISNHGFRN